MFIPIGLDDNTVRRKPWVSCTLIAANILVFLVLWIAEQRSDLPRRIAQQERDSFAYLSRHPYLEVPAELDKVLDDGNRLQFDKARRNLANAGQVPADWVIAREQQKLDGMVTQLFADARSSPIQQLGFVPGRPDALRIFTSMFVHAGWIHLIGNMVFLVLTGPFIEDAYGRILYPILYLLSGVVAEGVHAVHNPGSLVPTVGASGAIAGIMGAFLVRHAKRRIVFFWMPLFPIPWLARRIRVPAFVYLPFWFAGQVLLSSVSGEESGVAVWAHIGGFIFGFLAAFLIAAMGIEARYIDPVIQRQMGGPEDPELVQAMEAVRRGNLAEARRVTGHVLARNPRSLDGRRYAYDVAIAGGDSAEIGSQAGRLLETYIAAGETDMARHLIREAADNIHAILPPRFLMRAAEMLAHQGDPRGAHEMYVRLCKEFPADPSALRARLQAAELYMKAGDPERAREQLMRAASHPDYGPEWKQTFDKKLAELDEIRPATGYRGTRPTRI